MHQLEFLPVQKVPRVILFGMQGIFSARVLAVLLASEIEVCALAMPAHPFPGRGSPPACAQRKPAKLNRAPLTLIGNPDIDEMARRQHIPIWDLYRLKHPDTLAMLASYEADLTCVACFSRRIPREILTLPRLGCLNVHPSLLPKNRGPQPLFWTLRLGERRAGVTIHYLDEGMDSGDIVVQEPIELEDGIGYEALENRCAERGGALLAHAIKTVYAGKARRIPQNEAISSYHGAPEAADFLIPADQWDARRVYNFARGLRNWDQPLTIVREHAPPLPIYDAISYTLGEAEKAESAESSQTRTVPCRKGYVRVLVADTSPPGML